jgi:hypothetical protein
MIGVVALVGFGQNTQAGGTSVDRTAIDMDPTGNTSTSVGTIDSSLTNAPLNTPIEIDVVVLGVPSDGLFGVGYEMIYDPSIIKVTAALMATTNPSNVLQFSNPPAQPLINQSDIDLNGGDDTDGVFRVDSVGAGTNQESGDGRVTAITIECIAEGSTNLALTDVNTGGNDTMGVLYSVNGGGTYSVDQETEGSIGCGVSVVTPTAPPVTDTPPPTPTQSGVVTPTPTGVETETPTETGVVTPTPTGVETETPTETGVVTPTPTGVETETPTETSTGTTRIWGDWDCNGSITARDNQAVLRFILGQAPLSQTEPCPDINSTVTIDGTTRNWGDSDCNGTVAARDNQALLRFILGQAALSQTEPCPDLNSTVTASA